MFFGTKWSFKFSYFWTSMIPAYIIFILRIFSELSDTVLKIYWPIGSQRTIFILRELQWVVLYIFTIISVISIFVLFHFIKIKRNKIKATRIIEINFNDFDKTPYKNGQSNILCVETHGFYKVNPNLIGYLLGTVFSSGTLSFSWSNSILIKILIFFIVQLLIWLYVMNSSDAVPNIILVLMKQDTIVIEDKYWILMNRKDLMYRLTGIKRIVPFASTDTRNRLYVVQENNNAKD